MHDVNSTCRQNKLHHEHSAWYLKLIEPFEWRDDPNLVSHDARSTRVSCFLVFSFGAARLAASSSCSLLHNHWSLCTPKAHIYLKVILVQLNSWESRCLSLPLGAMSYHVPHHSQLDTQSSRLSPRMPSLLENPLTFFTNTCHPSQHYHLSFSTKKDCIFPCNTVVNIDVAPRLPVCHIIT
jgi:hypothetical protein